MAIHKIVEDAMIEHKDKIEMYQWAIISGVAILVYSEYISKIRKKSIPGKIYMTVPTIRSVQELLDPNGQFMKMMSKDLINEMKSNDLLFPYLDYPEFVLFKDNNIELLKFLLDIYIIPNIFKTIPATISKKFNIGNINNQLITESNDIDLFDRKDISEDQFKFVVNEIILQLLMLIPNIEKDYVYPEKNNDMFLKDNEILSIGSESAIAPIHINKMIIENKSVIDLLKFVSNTSIKDADYGYKIQTSIYNQTSITTIKGYNANLSDGT